MNLYFTCDERGVCTALKEGAHVVCQHTPCITWSEEGGTEGGTKCWKITKLFFFKVPVSTLYSNTETTMWWTGFSSHVKQYHIFWHCDTEIGTIFLPLKCISLQLTVQG